MAKRRLTRMVLREDLVHKIDDEAIRAQKRTHDYLQGSYFPLGVDLCPISNDDPAVPENGPHLRATFNQRDTNPSIVGKLKL